MVIVGVSAAYVATDYKIGTLARMGPGFFPCAIGCLMALVGLMMAFSARFDSSPGTATSGHKHEIPDLRGSICLILGVLAFIGCGTYLGLLPATFAIVFISALGDRNNNLKQSLMLAVVMSLVAVVIFWWALQIQLPLFKWGA
ncbi:MAG: tripartite tricarboxylate transporter TctB family protein [Curvibacter sp.]|nr:tripartite tricarboxylate transporter TctB family protein [Curvibacter sp.]